MSIEGFIGLFTAMFIVAAIPGPAVFAISSASMSGGFKRGLNMTIGLVLADFVFILLVVFGLAFVAESLGTLFSIIKYFCAAYLIWMGLSLVLSPSKQCDAEHNPANAGSDMLAGFLLTISNPKAIVFYMALFPAFIDFNTINNIDILGIMVCAFMAFGSVNLGYALIASRATLLVGSSNGYSVFRRFAGTVLTITGVGVAARA